MRSRRGNSGRHLAQALLVVGLSGWTIGAIAETQQPSPPPAVPDTQPVTGAATCPAEKDEDKKAKALPGPKYAYNRADDDFSYLDGPPGSYQPDFWDPIKRIHLSDDLTLRLGGDIRGRVESVTNKRYGTDQGNAQRPGQIPTEDTYFVHRYYYYADFQYDKLARFYVEGLSARIEDRDGRFGKTPVSGPEDIFDVHQMFSDLRFLGENVPLTLRFGRQELNYGTHRLVAAGDWSNVRNSFDGVLLFYETEKWRTDVFYTKPVEIRPQRPDISDETRDFYGVYNTYKFMKDHGIDLYFFALRNDGSYTNANWRTGDIGDLSNYTMGSRFWGSRPLGKGALDYENELAGQWGKAADDTIQAWMWSLYAGYTATNWPWKPRVGFGVDYASGDQDPFDDIHQTWNPLFPSNHSWLGYLDQIGRQNLWSENVNLKLRPTDNITSQIIWYNYSLASTRDALYNKSQQPVRRFPYGGVGAEVGNELDFTLSWQLDVHTALLFGYSHLWTDKSFFNRHNQPRDNPDLIYFQYEYKF